MSDNEKLVALKLKAVAAMAESLAVDIEKGRLWEGDLGQRMGSINAELNAANLAARRER